MRYTLWAQADRIAMVSFALIGSTAWRMGPDSWVPLLVWLGIFCFSLGRFIAVDFRLNPVVLDEAGNPVDQSLIKGGKTGKGKRRGNDLSKTGWHRFGWRGRAFTASTMAICGAAGIGGILELAFGVEGMSVSTIWCAAAGAIGVNCLCWLAVSGREIISDTAGAKTSPEQLSYAIFCLGTMVSALFLLMASAILQDLPG